MLGIFDFRMTFYDLNLNVVGNKTDVFYKIEGDHSANKRKSFDMIISRYENNNRTHSIVLYLNIENPFYIFTQLDRFRTKPSHYFFNITELFTRADFNQEDIEKHYEKGVPVFDGSNVELFKLRF